MKNKLQLLLLAIIIISFPSICFSELKTIQGQYCHIVTGDKKDIDWESEKDFVRTFSIENGLRKIIKRKYFLSLELVEDIHKKYLENFKVISHTEKGRNICEKVQFTIDTEVIEKVVIFHQPLTYTLISAEDYLDYGIVESFLKKYIQKENKTITIGILVENKTQNMGEVEKERLSDEEERIFTQCLNKILMKNVKIIERIHLNKILEEHKLSVTGITNGNTEKVGRIDNLDIILIRIIYDEQKTTKLLKVETGEVLIEYTTKFHSKDKINDSSGILGNEPDSKVWEYHGTTSGGDYYYDKTNLTKSSNMLSVWIYIIVTDNERKQRIEGLKISDLELSTKYQNFDHVIILNEIDCKNKQMRVREKVHYDNKGDVLYQNKKVEDEWRNILPDSIIETLYQKGCAAQRKSSE